MAITQRAFREYDQRTDLLDASAGEKQRWFDALAARSYIPFLGPAESCRVLEIGCNRGYLLRALQKAGFQRLSGLDLAPRDLDEARKLTRLDTLYCTDATEFLQQHPSSYDAVIFKAVLEHVPRDDVETFLGAVARALAPGGLTLCEVPNMDWYAASHERHMDITHETGYTRESLQQILGLFFREVEIYRITDPAHGQLAPVHRRVIRRLVFGLARRVLRLMGEDSASFWFENRSILAVARGPRETTRAG